MVKDPSSFLVPEMLPVMQPHLGLSTDVSCLRLLQEHVLACIGTESRIAKRFSQNRRAWNRKKFAARITKSESSNRNRIAEIQFRIAGPDRALSTLEATSQALESLDSDWRFLASDSPIQCH